MRKYHESLQKSLIFDGKSVFCSIFAPLISKCSHGHGWTTNQKRYCYESESHYITESGK